MLMTCDSRADESKPVRGPLKVLIADDEQPLRRLLEIGLRSAGYDAVLAKDGKEAMDQVGQEFLSALIDWKMPGADGLEVLRYIKSKQPELPVIMMSGVGQIKEAVTAMKEGAFEFIPKPFDMQQILTLLKSVGRMGKVLNENRALRAAVPVPEPQEIFIGDLPAARQLRESIRKVAPLNIPILLAGESGVGKGLVARLIHQSSARAGKPFVITSCPALPAELLESELFGHERGAFSGAVQRRLGRFEVAEGGTLFLDEISQLPLVLQPKLLNVLQDQMYQRVGSSTSLTTNIRLITATNDDLAEKVECKEFRADLFFRINVIKLEIPPLRKRQQDILPLAENMLAQWAASEGEAPLKVTPAARSLLEAYSWPGNVRELQNVLLRAAAFCEGDRLEPEHFAEEFHQPAFSRQNTETANDGEPQVGGMRFEQVEEMCLRQTLAMCGGNKSAAARRLGWAEKTVYNRMVRFGLR